MSDDGRGQKFGTVAEQYDQYRPDPPDEAMTLAGDLTGLNVLDVGAGTGKLTRLLLRHGARVSVIEPDEEMRKVLVRRSPDVKVLLGSAESIPAPDASFDAVFRPRRGTGFASPTPRTSSLESSSTTERCTSGGTGSAATCRGCES